MTWNPAAARARSRAIVDRIRFPQPPEWYPSIERGHLRPAHEVEDRALALNVVISCSYGMPTDAARTWLTENALQASVTAREHGFLTEIDAGIAPDSQGHQLQVEALWVLAWAVSLVPNIDWGDYCADTLVSSLPDLRVGESPLRFRALTALRDDSVVLDELDAAFCLTWGCVEVNLRRQGDPGYISQYVMWERRRALEWLMGGDWDDPDFNI